MSGTPTPLIATSFVALGGAIGAVARYQLGRLMTHWLGASTIMAFPWATLAANVLGCLAIGLLFGWMGRTGVGEGETARLFLGVGVLGGFTTFSAFSLELMVLIERGQSALALGYGAVSVLAGLTALYIGLIIMRLVG
jgi:CrcB protein